MFNQMYLSYSTLFKSMLWYISVFMFQIRNDSNNNYLVDCV